MKKIIITQKHKKDKYNQYIDVLENNYINYFSSDINQIIPISNIIKKPEIFIKNLNIDLIILSGGGDIHYSYYNGKNNDSFNYSLERDELENRILKLAVEQDIPVLGICRGMQKINVFFSGGLSNIKQEDRIHLHLSEHSITLYDNQLIKSIKKKEYIVNSYHNSVIKEKDLNSDLIVFAKSNDDVIEGIYHKKYRIGGIQWHPERTEKKSILNSFIYNSFINEKWIWEKRRTV